MNKLEFDEKIIHSLEERLKKVLNIPIEKTGDLLMLDLLQLYILLSGTDEQIAKSLQVDHELFDKYIYPYEEFLNSTPQISRIISERIHEIKIYVETVSRLNLELTPGLFLQSYLDAILSVFPEGLSTNHKVLMLGSLSYTSAAETRLGLRLVFPNSLNENLYIIDIKGESTPRLAGQYSFVFSDAGQLGLKGEAFSVVMSNFLLKNIYNTTLEATMAEMYRVLQQGGIGIMVEHIPENIKEFKDELISLAKYIGFSSVEFSTPVKFKDRIDLYEHIVKIEKTEPSQDFNSVLIVLRK